MDGMEGPGAAASGFVSVWGGEAWGRGWQGGRGRRGMGTEARAGVRGGPMDGWGVDRKKCHARDVASLPHGRPTSLGKTSVALKMESGQRSWIW